MECVRGSSLDYRGDDTGRSLGRRKERVIPHEEKRLPEHRATDKRSQKSHP